MTLALAPDDEEYGLVLPRPMAPIAGDSLVAYLLALDANHGWPAGSVVRMIRRSATGPAKTTRPGAFRQAGMFDLARLSRLAHFATVTDLERLTLAPLARWLRGRDYRVRGGRDYQLCPGCLRAGRGIPLLFSITGIDGCTECGTRLVSSCVCVDFDVCADLDTPTDPERARTPIRPFAEQTPFSCHGLVCGRDYADLSAPPIPAPALDVLVRRTVYARDLLTHAASQTQPLDRLQLRVALRVLRQRGAPKATSQPTIESVLESLVATSTDVPTFLALLADPTLVASGRGSRRARPRPVERATCPNPHCGGAATLPPGTPLLSKLTTEQRCRACGTRFVGDRIDFSFDDVPGYPASCASRNRYRLNELRLRLEAVCRRQVNEGRRIVRSAVFRAIGLEHYAPAWASPRAGLVGIIEAHRQRQRSAALALLPNPSDPVVADDPHLRSALELFRSAILAGPCAACRAFDLHSTPLYYRWSSRVAREGIPALQAFVSAPNSPFRHRPGCRWCT